MKIFNCKKNLFILTIVAIASTTTGLLTSCSTAQNQSKTTTNDSVVKQDSSTMDHNMTMDLGPADANYDLRFIDAMILHHQGAVVMAKEALNKSNRPEIKQLANDIIKAQEQEITQLQEWRKTWYPQAGDQPMAYNSKMGHMMSMSSEQMQSMMMNMELGEADAQFDLRFINAMIPHHEGAINMAKDALNKSTRPEIKQLAGNITTSQQKEINEMEQWKQSWY